MASPGLRHDPARSRWLLVFLATFLAVLFWGALPAAGHAQEATPEASGRAPAPYDEKEAQAIDGMLMCPVCPAETIDQAQVPLARQMRQLVREKLAQGESREQILDYFAGVYGQDVLAAPDKSGVNLIAWTVPVAAVLAAIAAGVVVLRAMAVKPGASGEESAAGSQSPPEELNLFLETVDEELALPAVAPPVAEGEPGAGEGKDG